MYGLRTTPVAVVCILLLLIVMGACSPGPPVAVTFPPPVTPAAPSSTAVAVVTPIPATPTATSSSTATSSLPPTPTPTSISTASATVTPAITPTLAPPAPPAEPTAAASPTPDTNSARRVKIVSSFPLRGVQAVFTRSILNAIGMALDEAGNRAGGVSIDWVSLDDSNPGTGRFDPDIEAANATQAAADPAVIAYVGPFNSAVAQRSIPILCRARIVMISPSNTVPALTKPGFGQSDEPARYYPGCTRNYARLIPTDELLGSAAAVLGARVGAHKAYVLTAAGMFGESSVALFVSRAAQLGIANVGRDDITASSAAAIAGRIAAAGADLVYDSAGVTPTPMHASILQALRAAGSTATVIGGPDFPSPSFILPAAGAAAEGTYAVDYLRPESYAGPSAVWGRRYQSRFGPLSPDDRFAINAFEATNVILAAMNGAAGKLDRASVLATVMGTTNFAGVLGRWSFDSSGDTTLAMYSVLRVAGGTWTTTATVSGAP